MFVNNQDNQNEKEILTIIRSKLPAFADVFFLQSKDKTAVFDFSGFIRVNNVDVKVRNDASTDYESYIISVDKVENAKKEVGVKHYIVYYFKKDGVVKVFHLEQCHLIKGNFHFNHQRAHKKMNQEVYFIPADDYIFKFKYLIKEETRQ